MERVIGYARVSSQDQNLARQIEALEKYVPQEMIVTDKCSGKNLQRPGYMSLKVGLGKLTKGDTLYIKSLDRLSRNKAEAKQELQYFQKIGVRVKILDLPTTLIQIPDGQDWILDMVNNILIEVLASIAEQERLTIRQRQKEGMDVMPIDSISGKKRSLRTGRCIGRPPVTFPENWSQIYNEWKSGKIKAVQAMDRLHLKKNSFYKLVKLWEESQGKT